MPLEPSEVDVAIGLLNQNSPKHQGPFGRISRLVNGQVVNYVPAAPGVEQKQTFIQRERFESLTQDLISSSSGATSSGTWDKPRLLSVLGDQLLSVDGSIPRIFNGAAWTNYSTNRVLTHRLEENIFHTSNKTIQAPDSAFAANGNECVVWSEYTSSSNLFKSYCGFKASNGAWIRTPFVIYPGGDHTMQRVVYDGTYFWVTCPSFTSGKLLISAFTASGVFVDDIEITREWLVTPGYWDVVAANSTISAVNYTMTLAQPDGNSYTGEDVDVRLDYFRVASGAIATLQVELTTAACNGPVAWSSNDYDGLTYLTTCGPSVDPGDKLHVYQITNGAITHTFDSGQALYVPDAITGYVVAGSGGPTVGVAISQLSQASQPVGPTHDPGLRCVQVWETTFANALTFIRQSDSVILQSRAFSIDGGWYAITYYQSGGGLRGAVEGEVITMMDNDFMLGEPVQPIRVTDGDYETGADDRNINSSQLQFLTQLGSAAITHNAGDSCNAATATWTLLNATLTSSCKDAFLQITGSGVSGNNTSWRIISNTATTVITETVGLNGSAIQNDTLVGVTAQVKPSVIIWQSTVYPSEGIVPTGTESILLGGTVGISGSPTAVNNGDYTIVAFEYNYSPIVYVSGSGTGTFGPGFCIICFPLAGGVPKLYQNLNTASVTISPPTPQIATFQAGNFDVASEGQNLVISGSSGINAGNDGSFPIIDVPNGSQLETNSLGLVPEFFRTAAIAGRPDFAASIHLADPTRAFYFKFSGASFDDSYRLAILTISDASHTVNNGAYQITQVLSSTEVIALPASGNTGQVNELLYLDSGADAIVYKAENTNPALQPCWLITPLQDNRQMTVGRFEYGVAYADWRFDGDTVPNNFPFALASVREAADGKLHFALPYRAQSFTAGQIAIVQDSAFSTTGVLQTTVGIKDFSIRISEINDAPVSGQPCVNSGELLIPGPQASQFTASGFTEDGINFAFEQPFLISQEENPDAPVGLTPKFKYQYIVVGEVTLENGDRVFSIPSPPLEVPLAEGNNQINISGRMNIQTNHLQVAISIYRTLVVDDVETTQHYKITNDLDVNGNGFTFSTKGLGAVTDTWEFEDTVPNLTAQSGEQLYTDKGFIARYPAPAFHQGIGSAFNRTWLLAYDGSIWMSGEKTEGDAVWFNPNFRYTFPTDDKPVTCSLLDDYIIVFCSKSKWYIPKSNFPGANGKDGTLPTPVQLPSKGGCTGYSETIDNGVAYASTAGGVWLITRNLTDAWLSEPVKEEFGKANIVRGMVVDGKSRLCVATETNKMWVYDQISNGWWLWQMPTFTRLISVLGAAQNDTIAYQDAAGFVCVQQLTAGADIVDEIEYGSALDFTFSYISLAGVRHFARLWALQLIGVWKGPHILNAVLSYPDEEGLPVTEFEKAFPTEVDPYIFEINPKESEETSTYGLRLFATFEDGASPTDTFSLEMITAEVGVEKGMNRMGNTNRIEAK